MARHLDPSHLPESVADQEWITCTRKNAESGFAALERGNGIRGTVDEHMARIDADAPTDVLEMADEVLHLGNHPACERPVGNDALECLRVG